MSEAHKRTHSETKKVIDRLSRVIGRMESVLPAAIDKFVK